MSLRVDTMLVSRLHPVPSYDFHRSAMIFSGGDPQIRTYEGGIFRQVLDVGGILMLVDVFSNGTVDVPELCFTIRPDTSISEHMRTAVSDLISSMFNINEDTAPFYHGIREDPIMASLTFQLRGVKIPTTATIFEALVDSVIEQQISLKAAHSMEKRLIRATRGTLTVSERVYYSYPTPGTLAETADTAFRACGLTRRKGEYIRGISQDILSGALDLKNFRTFTDTEAIIGELTKVRGVGRWTVELMILGGLHRSDAFPADRHRCPALYCTVLSAQYQDLSSSEARALAGRWGTWKGFAAYYLEIADMLGISPS